MILKNYVIRGTNPATGNSNKKTIRAFTDEDARDSAFEVGLVDPIEILESSHDLPSERQIDYATDLGINFPPDIPRAALSDMITRAVEKDRGADISLIRYAESLEIECSEYISEKHLATTIVDCTPAEEIIAFFLYSLYCSLKEITIVSPENFQDYKLFETFSKEVSIDLKFIASFKKAISYSDDDRFRVLFNSTFQQQFFDSRAHAFETMKRFLNDKFNLKRPQKNPSKPSQAKSYGAKRKTNVSTGGCLSQVVLLIVIIAILICFAK
ncbi:hypothetical protein [Flavihumibacter solisilvae]|uniref:Uncharacterized protein n=1 Tax=Flavihumibacter solisilvae TaxID=1349421 RepID=A0A0C1LJ94_9BACT|nr:hypothetical protein [Flavihumibacter solisilvae]KIC95463.1 hypothetical protein OI18_06155 [Flavihumibacter solisilvae]